MLLNNNRISRRALLRGAGVVAGLPFLEAMVTPFAWAAAEKTFPNRMGFLYVPNGIVPAAWTPPNMPMGSAPLPETMPRISSALVPYRNDILMVSNLTCANARALGDGSGDHGRAGAAFLTGVHPKKTAGKDLRAGISIDQFAAAKLADKTRFGSLELACEEGVEGGNCDNGYSCTYSNTLSWRTPTQPMQPEVRPRAVFERLFGSADAERDPVKRRRQELYEKSILDGMIEDAQKLKATLGGADRNKLDEYLSSIRDIEMRLQKAEKNPSTTPPSATVPSTHVPSDLAEHARLLIDLQLLAFQADLTRVSTLMMGIELSSRSYGAELGITEAHHGLTHHAGDLEKIEKVTQINCYHIKQLVYMLDRMRAIKEGDGTLLDHAMMVYGSAISEGNGHDHGHLTMVLAGRANGKLKPGRHIKYADETPITNLYMSMLEKLDIPVESFGDSTGKLDLLAEI